MSWVFGVNKCEISLQTTSVFLQIARVVIGEIPGNCIQNKGKGMVLLMDFLGKKHRALSRLVGVTSERN